jgi:hypothetical protein
MTRHFNSLSYTKSRINTQVSQTNSQSNPQLPYSEEKANEFFSSLDEKINEFVNESMVATVKDIVSESVKDIVSENVKECVKSILIQVGIEMDELRKELKELRELKDNREVKELPDSNEALKETQHKLILLKTEMNSIDRKVERVLLAMEEMKVKNEGCIKKDEIKPLLGSVEKMKEIVNMGNVNSEKSESEDSKPVKKTVIKKKVPQ